MYAHCSPLRSPIHHLDGPGSRHARFCPCRRGCYQRMLYSCQTIAISLAFASQNIEDISTLPGHGVVKVGRRRDGRERARERCGRCARKRSRAAAQTAMTELISATPSTDLVSNYHVHLISARNYLRNNCFEIISVLLRYHGLGAK